MLPIVGAAWLVITLVGSDFAVRAATVAALVVCVAIGARAARTTQRFRRRWMDPEELSAPPWWVTLITVAALVGAVVAVANLVADVQAERSSITAMVVSVISLTLFGLGAYAHLAGGRSVGAALRDERVADR